MLDFSRKSRRIFLLAWLESRSVLGLRIDFLGLSLCFLRLDCSFPILGLSRGLFPLALAFVFLPFSPLALITNVVGSLQSFRKREGI